MPPYVEAERPRHYEYNMRHTNAAKHASIEGANRNKLVLPLVTVPAHVETILEITTMVGVAVDVGESYTNSCCECS
jgi:hypothetical protein